MTTLPDRLIESGPLADAGASLVAAARVLGGSRAASTLRAWCVPALFHRMEEAFARPTDPVPPLVRAIEALAAWLDAARAALPELPAASSGNAPESDIAHATGQHYGALFSAFSDSSYWDEPVRLLRARLERNGVDLADLTAWRVLDAGCGGGRYTVAWRLLGAREVVGVDLSEIGIADARRRVEAAEISGVRFDQGSVLKLPYDDAGFDVAFSNGVLHHTTDWVQGLRELVRVLRPGGLGWLYLIERPGGLFWDMIEILRAVMQDESPEAARRAVLPLGLPANRVFYMLDHVMVPINLRLTSGEIVEALAAAGAREIQRLTRGTDFDRVEAIHRGDPFAVTKYGIGEHRFVFTR